MPDSSSTCNPVEIVEIRSVETGGNVRAYVSVRLGGVTIHGCKIVAQPGRTPWLAMPDKSWKDKEGRTKYAPVVELSSALKLRVQEAVLEAWERAR
jgi:DNA-binding cell septation regulator SpoVG